MLHASRLKYRIEKFGNLLISHGDVIHRVYSLAASNIVCKRRCFNYVTELIKIRV